MSIIELCGIIAGAKIGGGATVVGGKGIERENFCASIHKFYEKDYCSLKSVYLSGVI